MSGDEHADLCQTEDGEGIVVDPVHGLPNLKALPPSCFVPLPLRSRPGLGWVGLHAIFVVYSAHIVRPTAYRYNNVRRNPGYLCVRSCDSSLDRSFVTQVDRSRQNDLRTFGWRLATAKVGLTFARFRLYYSNWFRSVSEAG